MSYIGSFVKFKLKNYIKLKIKKKSHHMCGAHIIRLVYIIQVLAFHLKKKKVITRVENLKACLKVFYSNFKIRIFLGKEILIIWG